MLNFLNRLAPRPASDRSRAVPRLPARFANAAAHDSFASVIGGGIGGGIGDGLGAGFGAGFGGDPDSAAGAALNAGPASAASDGRTAAAGKPGAGATGPEAPKGPRPDMRDDPHGAALPGGGVPPSPTPGMPPGPTAPSPASDTSNAADGATHPFGSPQRAGAAAASALRRTATGAGQTALQTSARPVPAHPLGPRASDLQRMAPLSADTLAARAARRSEPVRPVIHVTIDRIDVRAAPVPQRTAAAPRPRERAPGQSLSDYLRYGAKPPHGRAP
jgi:hypothetical protein